MPFDAIVVLGCRVRPDGTLTGNARRRAERAAYAWTETGVRVVIASGGRRWNGVAEADAFARKLLELGVPQESVVRERASLNTRQNARHSSAILRERGCARIGVVTSDWHMERALRAFAHFGFMVTPLPAPSSPAERRERRLGELVKEYADRALFELKSGRFGRYWGWVPTLALVCACGKAPGAALAPGASAQPTSSVAGAVRAADPLARLLLAEDRRRPSESMSEALTAHDPRQREYAARALSRMAGASTLEALFAALGDEAAPVLAWAAFGLGRACAGGREADVTRALVLRAATLLTAPEPVPGIERALGALAQALGRCATDEAERSLRAWLKLAPALGEAAAQALGQLGARRGRLDDATWVALLDAAERGEPPLANALAAFARLAPPAGAVAERLVEVAPRVVARGGVARGFALRALGRVGAVDALAAAAQPSTLAPGELAEAARELAQLGAPGQRALGALLTRLVPESDAELAKLVAAPELGAVLSGLEGLAAPSETIRPQLRRLAEWQPAGDAAADAGFARRAALLRCGAARLLARGAWNDAALRRCDPDAAGRIGKLATLAALDQGKLDAARTEALRALGNDADPLVRQAALRVLPGHRELAAAPAWLAAALSDRAPGVVAAAAEILGAHPERALGAQDDTAASPDARVAEALVQAYRAAPPGNVGLQSALIDAAAALKLLGLMSELEAACKSDNPSLREHAERALKSLGQRDRTCAPPASAEPPAEELERRVAGPVRLLLTTDAGELRIDLDPSEAPVAVTRVVELARQGFYDGTTIHRMVPGFVAQLGDPSGDGYGAAPRRPLRSELGPTPLEAGAVAMAQAGPDTASSQFFVTLGRFPHLDGESARIGHAGPGWERVVVGDRIVRARVEE